jgi:endoglucanase
VPVKSLSVVLPFYKRLRAFELALKYNHANLQGTPERATEVILVLDEPSEEEAVLQVVRDYPQLTWRVLVNRREHGWRNPAVPINVGLRHARGEFVLIMSPESIHVTNVPRVLCERAAEAGGDLAVGKICWCERRVVEEKGAALAFEETEPKRFYGSACGPRAAFEAVRGYDESNKTWGCDDDNIRARLMLCGLKLKYAPVARAIHPLESGEVNHNRLRQREKTPLERQSLTRPLSPVVNGEDWGREFDEIVFESEGVKVADRQVAFATESSLTLDYRNKTEFWNEQRRGTNWFNNAPTLEWMVAAKEAGMEVVRLAPNNWKSQRSDFLIGSADRFEGIVEQDFQRLKEVLDHASALGLKVVLTTLSLPGARYWQANGDEPDFRIWRDPQYLPQAALFWKQLAQRLKNHPAIVGYNILNEPVPEAAAGLRGIRTPDLMTWYAKVENTPADLNLFNAEIVAAIREADEETPVVIDCGGWAATYAIQYLKPLRDDKVLYSVHVYDPYIYTNRKTNDGRFSYPCKISVEADVEGETKQLDVELNGVELRKRLNPVVEWQERHRVESNRIFVGEFGCDRMVSGAADYLGDLIGIFNRHDWHWAFFTFRSDVWDGMDYEVGTKPPGAAYWQAIKHGEVPHPKREDNPLWDVIKRELKS